MRDSMTGQDIGHPTLAPITLEKIPPQLEPAASQLLGSELDPTKKNAQRLQQAHRLARLHATGAQTSNIFYPGQALPLSPRLWKKLDKVNPTLRESFNQTGTMTTKFPAASEALRCKIHNIYETIARTQNPKERLHLFLSLLPAARLPYNEGTQLSYEDYVLKQIEDTCPAWQDYQYLSEHQKKRLIEKIFGDGGSATSLPQLFKHTARFDHQAFFYLVFELIFQPTSIQYSIDQNAKTELLSLINRSNTINFTHNIFQEKYIAEIAMALYLEGSIPQETLVEILYFLEFLRCSKTEGKNLIERLPCLTPDHLNFSKDFEDEIIKHLKTVGAGKSALLSLNDSRAQALLQSIQQMAQASDAALYFYRHTPVQAFFPDKIELFSLTLHQSGLCITGETSERLIWLPSTLWDIIKTCSIEQPVKPPIYRIGITSPHEISAALRHDQTRIISVAFPGADNPHHIHDATCSSLQVTQHDLGHQAILEKYHAYLPMLNLLIDTLKKIFNTPLNKSIWELADALGFFEKSGLMAKIQHKSDEPSAENPTTHSDTLTTDTTTIKPFDAIIRYIESLENTFYYNAHCNKRSPDYAKNTFKLAEFSKYSHPVLYALIFHMTQYSNDWQNVCEDFNYASAQPLTKTTPHFLVLLRCARECEILLKTQSPYRQHLILFLAQQRVCQQLLQGQKISFKIIRGIIQQQLDRTPQLLEFNVTIQMQGNKVTSNVPGNPTGYMYPPKHLSCPSFLKKLSIQNAKRLLENMPDKQQAYALGHQLVAWHTTTKRGSADLTPLKEMLTSISPPSNLHGKKFTLWEKPVDTRSDYDENPAHSLRMQIILIAR
ncbi:MAG: hypothetical protein A3F17_05285 [Gammaproteobacteria bacterium RIFCSPHIGHO2_12_FULL_41_15]|nr:MAG: hypothetical protein A3F17_05285 [Gammaproteobacteria bacterium RIFCSPHIGHO2_12_FULL_41_15]